MSHLHKMYGLYVGELYCPRCGERNFSLCWYPDSNGKEYIEYECQECGDFIQEEV